MSNMNSEEEVPVNKKKVKTGGQIFKEKHGFSKTLKRNMLKHGLDVAAYSDSIATYKDIRKKRKSKERATQKKKYEASLQYMRAKGKPRKRSDGKLKGSVKPRPRP